MSAESSKTRALGFLSALGGGVAWGFSGSCAQFVFLRYELDPLWVVSMRIIVAGIVMMAIACTIKKRVILEPVRRPHDVVQIVLFAVFGLMFTQFTYLMAISNSNASTATVLEYIGPVLVVLAVCVRAHRKPHPLEAVSVACVVAGTFFLATHGDPARLVLTPAGLGWGLLSAVSMVFYTLIPESLLERYDNVSVLAWAMLAGAVIMAAWKHPWTDVPALDPAGWLALIVGLTLLGTVLAFFLYFHAIKTIGPSRTSMLASVEVVSATLFAVIWLGTPFTGMDLLGLVFIMATVFLLARDTRD